ncbi:hypothetical protein Plhal304r1_c084g0168211 [Plasmopara halstedii]
MATVPKRTPNRSLAWDLGVRIEKKSDANVGSATHERFSIKTETTEGNKRRQVEAVIAAKAASTRAWSVV